MLTALIVITAVTAILLALPYGVEVVRPGDPVRLIIGGIRIRIKPGKAAPERVEAAGAIRKLRALRSSGLSALHEFGVQDLRAGGKALRKVVRSLRIRIHQLDVTIATSDPAMTGILFGSACAVVATVSASKRIHVTADFTRNSPEFAYRIEFSFIPWVLMFHTFLVTIHLPLRKIVRVLREVQRNMRAEEVGQHV
jgi:hypothetical protein